MIISQTAKPSIISHTRGHQTQAMSLFLTPPHCLNQSISFSSDLYVIYIQWCHVLSAVLYSILWNPWLDSILVGVPSAQQHASLTFPSDSSRIILRIPHSLQYLLSRNPWNDESTSHCSNVVICTCIPLGQIQDQYILKSKMLIPLTS